MAKPNLKPGYDPVPQEPSSRPQQTAKMASITSYWASLSKSNERRPSYKINKHGIMGEISHWTLPILFRWRASLWKTVWRELLIYLLLYLAISLIYRFVLMAPIDEFGKRGDPSDQLKYFEKVVFWFKNSRQMPLTFLLGFYVSLVVKRWWDSTSSCPGLMRWPPC